MNILVVLRMVPDVVEELEIAPDGKALDFDFLRMILSESDDHALEEALLLKERHGGTVTALAPDAPEVDDALYTALAKGADRVMKVQGLETGLSTLRTAQFISRVLTSVPGLLPADLVLTGVQAIDDLDGLMAPLLASHLGLPHLEIVTKLTVNLAERKATAIREYPGGVRGEFDISLPVVVGIQAAEKPPRYVPVLKVRAAMKSKNIETIQVPAGEGFSPLIEVVEMRKPEAVTHAEMLEGTPEQLSSKLAGIFAERGLL